MTNTTELKEVITLTKIIYTNNFTKEANYTFFKDNTMWTSNTNGDSIAEDEMVIFHTFKQQLPFDNLGIPSKELHGVLDSISEEATFTQNEDNLLIQDKNKKITLPIVKYVEPPKIDLGGLNYYTLPSDDFRRVKKRLLQFVDKNDENGSKIHFTGDIVSTDVNSIHTEMINADFMKVEDFAIPLQVFSIMENFAHLVVDDYLYLKSSKGTVLVTKYYGVMDLGFIDKFHSDLWDKKDVACPLVIPQFDSKDLFKVFGVNTKKPDREVCVSVSEDRIEISTGDDLTGFVSVELDSVHSNSEIKFKVCTEKFFDLIVNYESIYIIEMAGEKTLWGKIGEECSKYIVIDEII